MKKKQLTGKILRMLTAAAGSLTILLPLYFIVINSLKTSSEAGELNFALPQVFQWKNYIDVIQAGSLVRAFGNSMLMAGVSVVICLIVSAMAAFSISRDRNRLNKGLYNYFFLGLIAPVNYVATIFVLKALHIQNTFIGIILVHAALGIPFLIFLFDSFIGGIPRELDEAAV
ncbi:carbohydrate ABC transporter permease, partial [uncultured Robinsoniella sp.]|uniref:carbohydrate ABC transporter permease n=1 Tax=uncultured Robinsoniella sp. TaxID=904190 RepID=UPI00374E4E5D